MFASIITHATPLDAELCKHPHRNTRNIRNSMVMKSKTDPLFQGWKFETAEFRQKGGRARYVGRTGNVSGEQLESCANPANCRNLRNTRNVAAEEHA